MVFSNNDRSDFRVQYQIVIDDIRYAKTMMWKIVNYALLIFAALVAANNLVSKLRCQYLEFYMKCVLLLFIIIDAVLAIFYIFDIQKTIRNYRRRIVKVRNYLSPTLNDVCKIPSNYAKWNYDFPRYE
jgi:predicted membrane protein